MEGKLRRAEIGDIVECDESKTYLSDFREDTWMYNHELGSETNKWNFIIYDLALCNVGGVYAWVARLASFGIKNQFKKEMLKNGTLYDYKYQFTTLLSRVIHVDGGNILFVKNFESHCISQFPDYNQLAKWEDITSDIWLTMKNKVISFVNKKNQTFRTAFKRLKTDINGTNIVMKLDSLHKNGILHKHIDSPWPITRLKQISIPQGDGKSRSRSSSVNNDNIGDSGDSLISSISYIAGNSGNSGNSGDDIVLSDIHASVHGADAQSANNGNVSSLNSNSSDSSLNMGVILNELKQSEEMLMKPLRDNIKQV